MATEQVSSTADGSVKAQDERVPDIGGVGPCRDKCDEVGAAEYQDFVLA